MKLPDFIITRIEELNIQKEDYSLNIDEREELQLLEQLSENTDQPEKKVK